MKILTATLFLTIATLLGSSRESLALTNCEGSPRTGSVSDVRSWNNCEGTHTIDSPPKYSGNKYFGEWRNGKPHGWGTYIRADGNNYVGEWEADKMNGQGTYTYGSSSKFVGDKYVGTFKYGKRTGQGTYTFGPSSKFAGDKYVGSFKDGNRNGQGTYTFGPSSKFAGDKYVGSFKDGKKIGKGAYIYANGNKYVGESKAGKRTGQGTFTFGTSSKFAGNKYVGNFKDSKPNGQGTYTYANGNKYAGEWKGGKRHGQGTFTLANGRIQEGIWEDNKFRYAHKGNSPATARSTSQPLSNKTFSGLSAADICRKAIMTDSPTWDPKFESWVLEAKRRGLSEGRCAHLSGWFTGQKLAKLSERHTESTMAKGAVNKAVVSVSTAKKLDSGELDNLKNLVQMTDSRSKKLSNSIDQINNDLAKNFKNLQDRLDHLSKNAEKSEKQFEDIAETNRAVRLGLTEFQTKIPSLEKRARNLEINIENVGGQLSNSVPSPAANDQLLIFQIPALILLIGFGAVTFILFRKNSETTELVGNSMIVYRDLKNRLARLEIDTRTENAPTEVVRD